MIAPREHWSWPGLDNPFADVPVASLRSRWTQAQARGAVRRQLHALLHRAGRLLLVLPRRAGDELSATPKRTLVDVVTGLPIAALALPPARDWMLRWPHAWLALGLVVLARFVFSTWRRNQLGAQLQAELRATTDRLRVVLGCARAYASDELQGRRASAPMLRQNVGLVLDAIVGLAAAALQLPPRVRLHAALFLPMPLRVDGEAEPGEGCGVVAYDTRCPAEPSWRRTLRGDFAEGSTLESGRVQIVEDTRDPIWCDVFAGVESRSLAAFPVFAADGRVLAVVTLEADRPRVLTRRNATGVLHDVLSIALASLGDVLVATARPLRTRGHQRRKNG